MGINMSLRKIRVIGDELLRKKSREIKSIDSRILELLDDMKDTMHDREGVGLAAPQVGVLRRAVIVDVGQGLYEFINPRIITREGAVSMSEGCLSVPEEIGEVERPRRIVVRAYNRKGEEFELEAMDYFARAICHEIDHLDGILFIDKATNITKKE